MYERRETTLNFCFVPLLTEMPPAMPMPSPISEPSTIVNPYSARCAGRDVR